MGIDILNSITPTDIINTKIEAFKSGFYKPLRLHDRQLAAMSFLCDSYTEEVLFGGAAGGGKSFIGCEWLLWCCLAYPRTRWFIGRKHLSEVRKSTVVTMNKVLKKHNQE